MKNNQKNKKIIPICVEQPRTCAGLCQDLLLDGGQEVKGPHVKDMRRVRGDLTQLVSVSVPNADGYDNGSRGLQQRSLLHCFRSARAQLAVSHTFCAAPLCYFLDFNVSSATRGSLRTNHTLPRSFYSSSRDKSPNHKSKAESRFWTQYSQQHIHASQNSQ